MKSVNLCLFIFWAFLIFVNPLALMAQSERTIPSLINTVWKIPDESWETSGGTATASIFYSFEKEGKITRREIAMLESYLEAVPNFQNPFFNPFPWANQDGGSPYAVNSPYQYSLKYNSGLLAFIEEAGKYQVNGNRVTIEFSGNCTGDVKNCSPQSIIANVNGNQMIGEYTNKKTNKTSKWNVSKMSNLATLKSDETNSKLTPSNFLESARLKSNLNDWEGAITDYTQAILLSKKVIETFRKVKKPPFSDKSNEQENKSQDAASQIRNVRELIAEEKEYADLEMKNASAKAVLILSYEGRAIAKGKIGDKFGACEDFQESCKLGYKEACEKVKQTCK